MIGAIKGAIIIAPMTTAAEFCSRPIEATMLDRTIRAAKRHSAPPDSVTISVSMIERRSSTGNNFGRQGTALPLGSVGSVVARSSDSPTALRPGISVSIGLGGSSTVISRVAYRGRGADLTLHQPLCWR
ncbi:hypothetical protein MPSD_31420 [Mycobacterium pseudoshottsii JCM 15466]|uniref:Uncharacterized protein n=1 Tax=Mycobacterium pseudoshottsii TaxID=265949 RepID=A0A9N7LT74_9MYCO|nr:hypothetical protein MPSD_31420 [Mycobacterium pseudoshottsii JCM 15466]BDN82862.1 hypothetical protein NJB1907Z4_C30770 [Mycobacterium pseudoshottsii]